MTDVIIPIKNLTHAKQRLSGVLAPTERSALVLAMLKDLLGKLSQLDDVRVWVVANDRAVFTLAESFSANVIKEELSCGYNEAAIRGFSEIRSHKNEAAGSKTSDNSVVILPGDIPMVSTIELAKLITPTGADLPYIRIAPDHEHKGTNGLFMSSSDLLPPSFGPNSFKRHLAHTHGIMVKVINEPGLAQDIDTPEDLKQLASKLRQGATHDFLQTIDHNRFETDHCRALNRGAA